ncbi:hypothetical protein Q4519_21285 [Motilimonas sp. 1_MG-2023]|uniref:hypothetical protein n=1 Tax=Motilimonas sp. 1_MG-2023 TaxID=3062672 RepID=UPI0026E1ED3D|nr:hypothetical protein [Motilimonas sp. 1_MG-2023]MDO6528203.1 hypothetical protein [Motilimonas sp. 1_MG-2023]
MTYPASAAANSQTNNAAGSASGYNKSEYLKNWNKENKPIDLDVMYSKVRKDFCTSIDTYKEEMSSWWKSWFLSMDQKIIVNEKERGTADYDDNKLSSDLVLCPLSGELHIVHCFETEEFVPIPNTPFELQAAKRMLKSGAIRDYFVEEKYGPIYKDKIGPDGIKKLTLDPKVYGGKSLKITFYPDVTKTDMDTLLKSYDGTIDKLAAWLDSEWNTQKQDWQDYLDDPIDLGDIVADFFKNIIKAVVDAWREIEELFILLANPTKLRNLLSKYMENPELISEMMAKSKKEMADILMLLKDEARCFLCLNAIYSWFKLLSPAQLYRVASETLASILVEVVISILVPGGAILKNLNRLRDVAGLAAMTNTPSPTAKAF